MKRFFILASAAIVALASCAKTEVVYNDGPQEVAFKQITGAMTKEPTALTSGSLGVIAHYGANLYFDNTAFNWDATASVFKANPAKYWPFEGTLDFTVYAPYGTASYAGNTLEIEGVTAQEELYYGSERYVGTAKKEKVPVVLKHTSAKIVVNVMGAELYTVKNVVVGNANKTGDVFVKYVDPLTVTTGGDIVKNNFELVPATETNGVALTAAATPLDACYVLPGDQTYIDLTFVQSAATPITYTKRIALTGAWVANTIYTYNITITADEILFTASVKEWETADAVDKTNADFTAVPSQN